MKAALSLCAVCLDSVRLGDEEVEKATHLMHELQGGVEQYTPICDRHAEAARRYRLAFGISRAMPLGAELH